MAHWIDLRAMAEESDPTTYHRLSSSRELLLPDDQISDLELSVTVSGAEEKDADVDGFTCPSLAGSPPVRSPRGQLGTLQAPSGNRVKPSEWTTASTHGLPSSYEEPSYTNRGPSRKNPTNTSSRPYREPKAKDQYAPVAPPNPPEAWEDDAVTVERIKIPRHPDERQQDVAERINALTRQIQSQVQLCVGVSRQALALANENKHLVPKATSSVSNALATYVVKPALDLPEKLRTYCPALSESILALKQYEDTVRQMLACSTNARDMVLAQGAVVKGSGSDIKRLKDRLVEQDSMLRDSSSHLTRLIKERDALKRKLDEGQGTPTTALASDTPLLTGLAEHTGKVSSPEGRSPDTDPKRRDSNALADQLRELRLVVEELSLQQVSQQNAHGPNSSDEDDAGTGVDQDDEHPDWTLV